LPAIVLYELDRLALPDDDVRRRELLRDRLLVRDLDPDCDRELCPEPELDWAPSLCPLCPFSACSSGSESASLTRSNAAASWSACSEISSAMRIILSKSTSPSVSSP
jgi:hypothetical protein